LDFGSNMQVFEVRVVRKILEYLKVLKVSVISENQEVIKVGFFQKELMHLSYPQTKELSMY
jgi:hypothetical protein